MAKRNNEKKISEAMKILGKRGAKKGGKARWRGLSAAQRSEIARKAARARWDKLKS